MKIVHLPMLISDDAGEELAEDLKKFKIRDKDFKINAVWNNEDKGIDFDAEGMDEAELVTLGGFIDFMGMKRTRQKGIDKTLQDIIRSVREREL